MYLIKTIKGDITKVTDGQDENRCWELAHKQMIFRLDI